LSIANPLAGKLTLRPLTLPERTKHGYAYVSEKALVQYFPPFLPPTMTGIIRYVIT
jgi:hypothetical protein